VAQGNLSVLRIIVIALLLANILLFTMKFMQDDPEDSAVGETDSQKNEPVPVIELVEGASPGDATEVLKVSEEPASEESESEPAIAAPKEVNCVRLGPFESRAEMDSLQVEVKDRFELVQIRETKSIADKGYWVFMPPFPTRAAAESATKKMTEAGASEFYIVPDGQSRNAVSLGIYVDREWAEKRRGELNGMVQGHNIVVQLLTEIVSQYWLDAGPVDALNPALIRLSVSHPDVKQLQISCPSEALESQAAEVENVPPSGPPGGSENAPDN